MSRNVPVALRRAISVATIALLLAAAGALPARAAGSSAISGTAFQDPNRNGLRDAGEQPFVNMPLYLYDSSGAYRASAATDGMGAYTFGGLADGGYTVAVASPTWVSMRNDWVPTTTGSLYFKAQVTVAGSAVADFGLRPIVRSTTLGSPISAYTGPNGLRVESYNDVVTARELYDTIMSGSLIGPEAATTKIYFDYGTQTSVSTSVGGSPGHWSGWSASIWFAWLSWLTDHDVWLFHEYGHDWSLYNAYIVQQDDTLTAYLKARGVYGDSRLGTSKAWDPMEMIAEDYRQLFGTPTAGAYPQMNPDVPPTAQVPGLRDFLQYTFTQPPAPPDGGSGGGSGTTDSSLSVSSLSVSPQPVAKSASISFILSLDASATVQILDPKGSLVRTLLSGAPKPAGTVGVSWDRKNARGQRVKSGTYRVVVSAVDSSGRSASASLSFAVS